jgi:hypothetical protein
MTLAIAMAVDALARPRPSAATSPPPPPATKPTTNVALVQPPPPPVMPAFYGEPPSLARARRPHLVTWQVSAGIIGAVDSTTLATAGFTLQADVVRPHYSLGIEVRGDVPSSGQSPTTTVEGSLWTATLLPCFRFKVALLCGLAAIGYERVTATGSGNLLSQLWAAAGGRVAVELPVYKLLAIRLHVDVMAPLLRHRLADGDNVSYVTPTVSSAFGVAALAVFP